MIPVCVLKNGKYYQPRHVQWLAQQIPGLQCLSNVDVPGVPTHIVDIPWSSFWCKMVMWNPGGPLGDEDLLFFDLDTVVVGDIAWMMQERSFFTLRDWYFSDEINSAIMRIPKEMKRAVWERWIENPEREIYTFNTSNHIGDQGFLTYILGMDHGFWQDTYTGRVVSYKQDIAAEGMPGFDAKSSQR